MPLAQQNSQSLIEFTLVPLFEDRGIPLAVMGILVVFMALVLVATFIHLLPHLISVSTRTASKRAEPPATVEPLVDEGLSEEIVVVIAAAVAEAMPQPHRIVRIRGLTPADQGWSFRGRAEHHHSHRVAHRDRQ